MHPMQWSKWSEKWLTHPSTLRRVQAIARKAAIPLERLPEMRALPCKLTPTTLFFIGNRWEQDSFHHQEDGQRSRSLVGHAERNNSDSHSLRSVRQVHSFQLARAARDLPRRVRRYDSCIPGGL